MESIAQKIQSIIDIIVSLSIYFWIIYSLIRCFSLFTVGLHGGDMILPPQENFPSTVRILKLKFARITIVERCCYTIES